MTVLFFTAIVFGHELFRLYPLNFLQTMFLIGGGIAIPFIMDIIYRIGNTLVPLKEKLENITKN